MFSFALVKQFRVIVFLRSYLGHLKAKYIREMKELAELQQTAVAELRPLPVKLCPHTDQNCYYDNSQ